jgi:KDO2-lipid IV(A) lauroyltransferase
VTGADAQRRRGFDPDALAFLPVRAIRAALANRAPEQALAIGAAIGRRIALLGGGPTDLSRINLGIAFPEASVAYRERVLFDAYANLGRGVAELALLQGPHRTRLLEGVVLEGEEHVVAAEAASPTGGALIITGHFGTWDLYAAALAQRGHALTVVHRGFGNRRLTEMMSAVRRDGGGDLEEIRMGPGAAAGLLSALRRGRKCILLLDQNARADEGVFVPFFSRLACTRSAPALVAMRRHAPVLPAFGHRIGAGPAHVVRIGPAIPIEPGTGDPRDPVEIAAQRENVARMTAAIEQAIRRAPEHWLWSHRRWRTRPEEPASEQPPVYPERNGLARSARHWLRDRLR